MSNKKKYPCIVNRSGQAPKEYIGIMFNGDQGVYRKATVKALKKAGTSKEYISAVKAADGDLAIAKILIEADLIENLYFSVVDEAKGDFSDIESSFSKTVSQLGKDPDIHAVIAEVDEAIQERVEVLCKKAYDIHEETEKTVLEKFHEACKRKLEKLKKEIQTLQEEQDKIKAIIQKIS
ncbi:MAG: hypothetical protein E7313_06635 [Clostridiales bacterium]|nr:hypothetical protein [Clostridiales bacterium]